MCGICGYKVESLAGNDIAIISKMAASIAHRGNEATGYFVEAPIAFAHQRLSILDLDQRANQPMKSADNRFVITFNGEIYNFHEIKSSFGGFPWRTTSDTEVLLELWVREGPRCLQYLNGMFAFSIYDRQARRLYCVRDRLGVKPLYYWSDGQNLAFASEAKALLQLPMIDARPDYNSVSDYLSLGYITGKSTIFAGIKKLAPGHYLQLDDNGLQSFCYWRLADKIVADSKPLEKSQLLALIESAVEYRLISDVPVGSFLSGGIDSSAVTAIAAGKCSGLETFTIGFNETAYDESAAAGQFAASLGLRNQTDFFTEPDHGFLQRLVRYFDQPFADTSTLPFYQLCQNASRNIKTVLCGDGGDELFAGYETRRADLVALTGYRSVPFWKQLTQLGSGIMGLIPSDRGKVTMHYKLRQFFEFAHLPPEQSHFSWRLLFTEAEKRELLDGDIVAQLAGHETWQSFARLYEDVKDLPMLQQQAIVDLQTWLADDILYKADQASMAHTLEIRAPFLDYRLVEAAFSIPEQHKFDLLRTKTLLRQTLAPLVPKNVLRKKKEGFGSPVSIWLEGQLAPVFLECINDRGFKRFFPHTDKIMQLYQDHCSRVRDNGYRLWALLMFSLWQKEWLKC